MFLHSGISNLQLFLTEFHCTAGWKHLPRRARKAFLTQHKAPYSRRFWCARGSWGRGSMRPSDSSRHQSHLWPGHSGEGEKRNIALLLPGTTPLHPCQKPQLSAAQLPAQLSPCSSQGLVYIRELNQRCGFKPVQLNCYTFLIEPRFQQKLLVFKWLLANLYFYVGEILAWWAANGYRVSPKCLEIMQGLENKN